MTAPAGFKDYFSGASDAYERYRPADAPELFTWLAAHSPGRRLAVDVATGSGQSAIALAAHFDAVIATDASAAQLKAARAHPQVEYRCERAESLSLAAHSADLLVSSQAAHWFDWPAFTAEARRVLRPGGLFAVWCYGRFVATPAIDRLVEDFSRDLVGPYWPRERYLVDDGYRDLVPPFPAVAAPPFEMRADWDLDAALGYFGTWSAVTRYRTRHERDPVALLAGPLAAAWGGGRRALRWPLAFRAARA